jgi:hypothetical protein
LRINRLGRIAQPLLGRERYGITHRRNDLMDLSDQLMGAATRRL